MKLDRLHYGRKPIHVLYDVKDVQNGVGYCKPGGLWYSVANEWPEWCYHNHYNGVGKYLYAVDTNKANILSIDNIDALETFHKTYSHSGGREIDWLRVAVEYDGIEIAPYQYEARYSLSWYYGWDVASGVVWRASKLKVEPIQIVTGVIYGA